MGYVVLVVVIVAFAWWRFSLYLWPYARCRWCRGRKGKGTSFGSTKGRWGDCWRCGGKGQRLRWTARG